MHKILKDHTVATRKYFQILSPFPFWKGEQKENLKFKAVTTNLANQHIYPLLKFIRVQKKLDPPAIKAGNHGIQFHYTQRNLFKILLHQPKIRLYLPFSD